MPNDSYTLLILPKKSSSAKKISLSVSLLKGVSVFIVLAFLCLMYFSYDYLHISSDHRELNRLKRQTVEQRQQIEGLVAKVEQFAGKMEELKQFDKQVRIMADMVKGKGKEPLYGIGGPVDTETRLQSRLDAGEKAMIAGLDNQVGQLMNEAATQKKSFADLLAFLKKKQSVLAATPSIWPVTGLVTSEFGRRISPFDDGEREFHKGIDIATRSGRPIQAPADGVVAEVTYQNDVGRMVKIDHGHGMVTMYAHLSKAAVEPRMAVKRGDVIGYVGNTGRSTGPHLHYSITLNGVLVNPRKYFN